MVQQEFASKDPESAAAALRKDVSLFSRSSLSWLAADWTAPPVRRTNSTLGVPSEGRSRWPAAVGHLVCLQVGAGVLALPYAVSQLGLLAGPLLIVASVAAAMLCGLLLTHAYRGPMGERRPTYRAAIAAVLGPRAAGAVTAAIYLTFFAVSVAYTVLAADSMAYIARTACGMRGVPKDGWCFEYIWAMVLIFSAVQLVLAQLPNLESTAAIMALGALMSIGYSLLAMVFCLAGAPARLGSLGGRPAPPAAKAMGVLNAIGTVLFSNSAPIIVIDVQHTLREPPESRVSMSKAVYVSFALTMVFYAVTGVTGYLALGDAVSPNVLTSFQFDGPATAWVPLLANVMVLVHLVPAYQVVAQPLFVGIEAALVRWFPRLESMPEAPVRLVYRTLYVCVTAVISATLPFFASIAGLIGAISFWPTIVYAPIAMYLKIKKPRPAVAVALRAVNWAAFALALGALVGSAYEFAAASKSFRPFGM
ncbi:MAG: transmembrane amino acid transporter protein-domain-containing protein [Monoraphidium minutum]|nr:MAG: transmembrane amino acid transporter protein-domain-containing protein [Monoraphidium minutum]